MSLPIPTFINRDATTIINEMVADYSARTGKTLEPAQVETMLINAFAYRELLLRNQIQDAALQNLVDYARFPMLDNLGTLVGVTRLPAALAQTTILLTLTAGHGDVVIPSGLRVSSTDGRAVFELVQDTTILTGVNSVSATFIAQTAGVLSNNYAIGTVSVILDPQPYLATASNTSVTNGGSDEETDEQLRDRIKLAPSAFSNAGSYKAYEYWAKTTSPLIIDVAVTNPTPGTVQIYPLTSSLAVTSAEMLSAVLVVLSADKRRPLTDTVIVTSPTAVNTDITIGLILYAGTVEASVLPIVTANITAFIANRKKLLGQDLIIDQIKALCMITGVYKANVTVPSADLVITETQFANITSINVTVTGTNAG